MESGLDESYPLLLFLDEGGEIRFGEAAASWFRQFLWDRLKR